MSDRLPAVLLLVGVVALAWAGMAWGWRRRAGRQATLAPPAAPPADPGPRVASAEGLYVGSVTAGDWLDRVVPHGLGARAKADLVVHPDGIVLDRDGSPSVWTPRSDLLAVRRDTGLAGKVTETGGLVVWTWRLGDVVLESGLRPRYAAATDPLLSALQSLTREVS
jgi:hypothetical protein